MRLGIFGGTFNPVHIGHLRSVEEVREALGLDRVVFVPAKLPPHKSACGLAAADFRLKVVREAVSGNPFFDVSDVELLREGPSFSIDTLEHFAALHKPEALWFVMGTDQYEELHTWKRYGDILALADVAVMRRPPDVSPLKPPAAMESEYEAGSGVLTHRSGRSIRLVEVTGLAVSSTRIREALARGGSIRYLVPEKVREMIEANSLEERCK